MGHSADVSVFKNRDLLAPRSGCSDFAPGRGVFTDEFERDPAAKEKFWKEPAKIKELLRKTADALAALTEWSHDPCDHATRAVAEAAGVKPACSSTRFASPSLDRPSRRRFLTPMVVLGQERVVRRLRDAMTELG